MPQSPPQNPSSSTFSKRHDPLRLFQLPIRRVQALYEVLGLFNFYVGAPVFFVFEKDRAAWYELVHERSAPLAIDFEDEHGGRFERDKYNQRNMDAARDTLRPVVRKRNGLVDFCVPVTLSKKFLGWVVSGAIQERLMDRAELETHYQRITQHSPRENPVQFSRYVRGVLSQPYVARDLHHVFTSSLELVAATLCGSRRADDILKDTMNLRYRYYTRRYLHSGWLESLIWRKFHKMELELRKGPDATPWEKSVIGLNRIPSVVMAAMPGGTLRDNTDHVDTLLAAQHLRESARRLAGSFPNTIAGGTEEFGTVLLTSPRPGINESQSRLEIRDLAMAIAQKLEKELSFHIHIGVGRIEPWNHPLEQSYHEAVQSMMWASYSNLQVFVSWDKRFRKPDDARKPEDKGRQMVEALRNGSRAQLDTTRDLYWQTVLGLCGRRAEILQVYLRNMIGITVYFLEKEIHVGEGTTRALSKLWIDRIASTDDVDRLGALFRKMIDEFYHIRVKPKDGPGRVSMEMFVTDLRKRYYQPMRLSQAAAGIGISVPVFCRKFKAFTGRSFIDYMNLIRIEEAKHFLVTTALTVSQISREVGFSTASYFIRVFQKKEGVSPGQYRVKMERRA